MNESLARRFGQRREWFSLTMFILWLVLESGNDKGVAAAVLLLRNSAQRYVTFWPKKIRGFLLIFSLKWKRLFVIFND
jgi:hypothetical protein